MDRSFTNRIWLLRLGAVLLGLFPFLVLEVTLRGLDLPSIPPDVDPFVDLHSLQPLFEPGTEPGMLEIGRSRMNLFRPATFRRKKTPGTFRVFALGGSTTQGEPYSTETAFPKWLEIGLKAASGADIEVINCGGLSYASYRVLAVLGEVLNYEPDLVVVYTGQNEFLERRSYEGYEKGSLVASSASRLSSLRTIQLAKSLFSGKGDRQDALVKSPTKMAGEVDALLDYQGGLEQYHRADDWQPAVVDHFRWNLNAMVERCRTASVPLLLVKPVSNLKDCPPMKFETDAGLPPDQQIAFESLWDEARSSEDRVSAQEAVSKCLAIDPDHAGANYLLGSLLLAQGEYARSEHYLIMARDGDVCPLRAPTGVLEAVSDVARSREVPMVDAASLFAGLSERGIVGNRWLVDHIHPNVEGHQILAKAIAEACIDAGFITEVCGDWREQLPEKNLEYLVTLGEEYFHRGNQRLEGLRLWTQGRAKKVHSLAP